MKLFCSMLLATVFFSVLIGTAGCTQPAGGGPVPEANAAGDPSQTPKGSEAMSDDPKSMRKSGKVGSPTGGDGL